jgi:hypothetical protein
MVFHNAVMGMTRNEPLSGLRFCKLILVWISSIVLLDGVMWGAYFLGWENITPPEYADLLLQDLSHTSTPLPTQQKSVVTCTYPTLPPLARAAGFTILPECTNQIHP